MLLSRDNFREAVFKRDNHRCVNCGSVALDAHHIMERRLFDNGGYFIENGVSLCGICHMQAETTTITTTKLRELAKIQKIILPPHLYSDQSYDKWGNIILSNDTRIKGELFYDESVQKILAKGNVLDKFINRIKYPRTYHLPFSPGFDSSDRVLSDTKCFKDKKVVVTVKMDGEQTTLYDDYLHSRSIERQYHSSRTWVQNWHAKIAHLIPKNWRICGENLYAKHSIHYQNLSSYFMAFSIWNDVNECLSWSETQEYAMLLDIPLVPVLYRGLYDENLIQKMYAKHFGDDEMEGFVVRIENSFPYSAFRHSVAKYVRKNHVTDSHNWLSKQVIPNQLKKEIS